MKITENLKKLDWFLLGAIIFMIATCLVLGQGCAGSGGQDQGPIIDITINDETKEQLTSVTVRIGARELGKRIAEKRPEIIEPGLIACQAFTGEGDIKGLIARALQRLDEELLDDPYLADDLAEIMALIDIDVQGQEPLTAQQIKYIKSAVKGFGQGLGMARR
ncbi:MAG: hypothetical protein SV375_00025 [Thermodesulfobacteriota bacterium]|nr:hypothetical protein [Thermodesulfobacteriota bacterium]